MGKGNVGAFSDGNTVWQPFKTTSIIVSLTPRPVGRHWGFGHEVGWLLFPPSPGGRMWDGYRKVVWPPAEQMLR